MSVKDNKQNFNPQQISIMLISPLKETPIPLTLDNIYHPTLKNKTGMSQTPYITSVVEYPIELINKLTSQGYNKVISFFFNQSKFDDSLRAYNHPPSASSPNEILEYNVMVMLKALFPTYYPSINNISTSYNEYILKVGKNLSSNVARLFALHSFFGKNQLSYIIVDNKKYTITKTVLLNDLLNNPVYKNVIDKYTTYSLWSDTESVKIDKELQNGIIKLIYKFDEDDKGKKGSLTISTYKDRFTKIDPTAEISTASIKRKETIYTINTYIDQMILSINEIYKNYGNEKLKEELSKGPDNISEFIRSFNQSLRDIQDLYKLILELKLMTKTTLEFSNNLDKLIKESTELNMLRTIKNEYIGPKNINVKLDEKNQDLTNLLRTKYKTYTDFMEVINTIIAPSRESTNAILQESINNYSQNQNTGVRFNHIMDFVSEKYMFKSIQPTTDDIDLKNYMNIGINRINMNEQSKPQYEIYVSMNLIENEYNIDTINGLKCIYDGFSLGKELENLMDKVNPHVVQLHSLFLPQSEIDSKTSDLRKNDSVSTTPTGNNNSATTTTTTTNSSDNANNTNQNSIKAAVGGRRKTRNNRKIRNTRKLQT